MSGPWLVVIDLQHVFADPDSYWATERFAAILPRVTELITEHAPQVVLTRFVAPASPTGAWIPYYREWPQALSAADDPQYDLVPEIAELQRIHDFPVITRSTFGKWDAELAGLVGPDPTVIVCGVSTDCCVLSTALAAADAGAAVRIAADACAGASDDDHQRALAAMGLYAPLITVA